jgi:hypothetical protein
MLRVTNEHDLVGFLDDLVGVYREAFAAPPYYEDEASAERFRESVVEHASREGFRCVVANDDKLVGFAYGYAGWAGSWWYERVSDALSEQQVGRWLEDYFELVELAVLPDRQGEGIGGTLHD